MSLKRQSKWSMNLLLLLWGRMVSDTGSRIQMIVVPLYILDIGGDAGTVGLFTFLTLVPALVVYPFAGVLGDRLNRKRIMVLTDIASGAVILSLAALAYAGRMSLLALMLVQVLISLLNGLFDPATKGILPQLVEKEDLPRANSALATMRTLSGLVGPVIGTTLYALFGISILFLINGISFLLSGISELFIRYQHQRRAQPSGFSAAMRDGGSFVLKRTAIRNLCLFLLFIYALGMPLFQVTLPLLFRTQLFYTDTQYGYLQIAIMAGALLGGMLVGAVFAENQRRALVWGLCLLMGSSLGFALLTLPKLITALGGGSLLYLLLLAIDTAVLSAAVMFINVPLQTFIQGQTPPEYMSRVFSMVGLITKGGLPFGALLYGAALSKFDVFWTSLAAFALMTLASILFLKKNQSRVESA